MTLELIDISIGGKPDGEGAKALPVTLTYSDQPDISDAKEWIEVQLISDASYGRVLAEVEKDALVRLRSLVSARIQALESLERARR